MGEQSSLLRAVVESTADGLLVVARNGAITCFNSRFARMWRIPDHLLGAGRDEALLDYVRDQVVDPEAFLGRVRELYAQPEATSFDVVSLRDDRVFERYSQPQFVAGDVVGRVWSFRDVTEARRVEAALRRNQYAIDHATEAILWTREDGRLVYANVSACRHLGYSREELLRLCVADVGPDVPPEAWPGRWRAIRDAGHLQFETRARRRDGSVFPAEVTVDHVRFEGVEYACATGRDISGRRALEERARRAEHTALMGSLTLGVAHEVRNPLFAISANLDALEHSLPIGEEAHAVMSAVRHEVDRLSGLMARFIDYGAPPAVTFSEDRLGPVVDSAASACAELAAGLGVRVERRGAECGARVRMIPLRLQHVFENLIRNAIQQSPRDGVVEIQLTLLERDRHPWVRCEMRDTGPGFLEADLSRAFAPFFTRRRGSTGLGLSIAQRIVEEHEGHIVAGNRVGGGAILTVDLPAVPQPAPGRASSD